MAEFGAIAKEAATKLNNIDSDLSVLQTELSASAKDAVELNKDLDEKWAELIARVDSLNTKVTSVNSDLEESFSALEQNCDELDQRFGGIETTVEAGTKLITDASKEWSSNADTYMEAFKGASETLKKETDELATTIEKQSDEVNASSEKAEGTFESELHQNLENAKSTIEANGEQIERMVEEVLLPQLATQKSDVKEQLSELAREMESKADEAKNALETDADMGTQNLMSEFNAMSGGALTKVEETVVALIGIGESVEDLVTIIDAAATPVRVGVNTSSIGIKSALDVVTGIKEFLDRAS